MASTPAEKNWSAGEEMTAAKFNAMQAQIGLDSEKSASPTAGQSYYATDTETHYVCFVAGTWAVAVPIAACILSVAGDNLVQSANTERNTTSASYTKVKEMTLARGGVLRIKVDVNGSTAVGAYARIYRNGVAVGTEIEHNSGTYATYSEDISGWAIGDKVQVYIKHTGGSDTTYVKNFRIYEGYWLPPTVNTD